MTKLFIYVYSDGKKTKVKRKPYVIEGFKEDKFRELIYDLNTKSTPFVLADPLLIERKKIHHVMFLE